jgi:hypothetical protein
MNLQKTRPKLNSQQHQRRRNRNHTMSYFTEAFSYVINETGYTQRDIATHSKIPQSTISKFKKGQLKPDESQLVSLIEPFAKWPELQKHLVIARAKDVIPPEFVSFIDPARSAKSKLPKVDSEWDKDIEKLRIAGLNNDSLKETISFLASVY